MPSSFLKSWIIFIFVLPTVLPGEKLLSNDTIPPVFISPPVNMSVSCAGNVHSTFNNWLNNNAGAVTDDPQATISHIPGDSLALMLLNNLRLQGCSGTAVLSVGFFAFDTCGNYSSDTLYADFTITDNTPPSFLATPMNKSLQCDFGILDSLQNWIDNIGDAVITDNCSDTVTLSGYNWTDNVGNSGFGEPGIPTPITIDRSICLWSVDITFFVQDECGNINAGSAVFSLSGDTSPPLISTPPADTVISCTSPIPPDQVSFSDGCDGLLIPTLIQSSTQSSDTSLCSFYNYEITRTWSISDACSNQSSYTQVITVRDTTPPAAALQSIIALDCSEDIDQITELITPSDNCFLENVDYHDSLLMNLACNRQILREYVLTDVCGNTSVFSQNIQLRDFNRPFFTTPPRDTTVLCSAADLESAFRTWRDSMAFAIAGDLCNEVRMKALAPGNYTDTTSIRNAPVAAFNVPLCQPTTVQGILGFQIVEFVAYDICGNIISDRAVFTAIDTLDPIISSCPPNKTVVLRPDQCDTLVELVVPVVGDNCTAASSSRWSLRVNNDFDVIIPADTFITRLASGMNTLKFTFQDCAANSVSCIQEIEIRDVVAPVLICPEETTVYLPPNSCDTDYRLLPLQDYLEACAAPVDFNDQLPPGKGYVEFLRTPGTGIYKARNNTISFRDLTLEGELYHPRVRLEYKLNIAPGSRVLVLSELGDIIYTINADSCESRSIELELNKTQFDFWLADHTVNFTIQYDDQGVNGTTPCQPGAVQGMQGKDNESFFRIRLTYSDVEPSIEVLDLQSQNILNFSGGLVRLSASDYQLKYAETDAFGNEGICYTAISVRDTVSPVVSCKDIVVEAGIQSSPFYPLPADRLLQSISDNCAVDSIAVSRDRYSCSDIGSSFNVELSVFDIYGNRSACSSIVTVKARSLQPAFSSNLCLADSLRLLSGVDPMIVQSYMWTGPDGFFSEEANPLILSIDNSNSGNYLLEIISDDGCRFIGSVNITVNQFSNPVLSSDSTAYCESSGVLLQANNFSEDVDYLWYEGIAPNGVLIAETSGPDLVVDPLPGKHFYYIQVRSEDCTSNFSSTLSIDILPVPTAEVDNPFISVCEGEEIILGTSTFNPIYNYHWSGPNGYFSRERIPPVIQNAGFSNAGEYYLSVDNGICSSDSSVSQVVVFDTPPKPVITGKPIFCEGENAVLSVPNIPDADRYHWYKDGILVNSISSNNFLLPAISKTSEGEWVVVAEKGFCFSDSSAVFTVRVEARPNIGASNSGPVCEGDEVTLTTSFIPGAAYIWTSPRGTRISGRIITVPAEAGMYTVEVTTENNCTAFSNTMVELKPRPEITALSNTSSDCMNASMSFHLVPTVFPSGNYIYEWTGPSGFTSNEPMPVVADIDSSHTGIYTLTVILDGCASDPVHTEVDFELIPEKPGLHQAYTFCENDTAYLEINNPGSRQGSQWLWLTPGGLLTTNEPFLEIPSINSTHAGEYSVLHSVGACRSPVSAPASVSVIQSIPKPAIVTMSEVCQGEDLVIQAIPVLPGASYHWSTPSGTTTITQMPQLTITDITESMEGTYGVHIQQGDCQSADSETFELEVLPQPMPPLFPNDTIIACLDDDGPVSVCLDVPTDPTVVSFQIVDIMSGNMLAEQSGHCFDLRPFLPANGGINLGVRSTNGSCFSEIAGEAFLFAAELPQQGADILGGNRIICDADFITLTADVPEGVNINWSSPDPGIIFYDDSSPDVEVAGLGNGHNTIILNSSFGTCGIFYRDTVRLEVFDNIITQNDTFSDAFAGSITVDPLFNDVAGNDIVITEVSQPDLGEITFDEETITYIPPNFFAGVIELEYTVCYNICPSVCATGKIVLDLGSTNDCFAGNVVTPNGDGYNDSFIIPCLETGRYPMNELRIFNQWGDELFAAAPYLNNWQGTYKGDTLPPGTYFYILNLGEGEGSLQGFIVIEL